MLTKNPQDASAVSAPTGVNAALFNYIKQEWGEIKAAFSPIWYGALPKETREKLVEHARCYRAELRRTTARQGEQAWQKIADRIEAVMQDISVLVEEHLQFLKNIGGTKRDQLTVRRDYADNFHDPLCTARDNAREYAEPEDPPFNNPRLTYEFEVLSIWTSLGGELKVSRHPRTGKIQGPLARFFRAVTIPVMGTSAPSLESLPDIVQRQRKLMGKLR